MPSAVRKPSSSQTATYTPQIDQFFGKRVKNGNTRESRLSRRKRAAKKNARTSTKPVAVTADPSQLWTPPPQVDTGTAGERSGDIVGKRRLNLSLTEMMRKEKRQRTIEEYASRNKVNVIKKTEGHCETVSNADCEKSTSRAGTIKVQERSDPFSAKPPLPHQLRKPMQRGHASFVPDEIVVRGTDLASSRISASGAEAILYDRTLLPNHYQKLLEVLDGIESAMPLIRLRNKMPDFRIVSAVAARASRRSLSLENLAQLRYVIPEVIQVLALDNDISKKPNPDNVLVHLCEAPTVLSSLGCSDPECCQWNTSSSSGRRRLLHRRLLQKVREHHDVFLKKREIVNYESNIWHADFEADAVPQIPADALFTPTARKHPASQESSHNPTSSQNSPVSVSKMIPSRCNDVKKDTLEPTRKYSASRKLVFEEKSDGPTAKQVAKSTVGVVESSFISSSLLDRVRARAAARAKRKANNSEEDVVLQGLVSRLPRTLDAIRSILALDRRSSLTWGTLVKRLAATHPSGWEEDELERQLNAIVTLAPAHCSKIRLSKPGRASFAFRIKSMNAFKSARRFIVNSSKLCVKLLKNQ